MIRPSTLLELFLSPVTESRGSSTTSQSKVVIFVYVGTFQTPAVTIAILPLMNISSPEDCVVTSTLGEIPA